MTTCFKKIQGARYFSKIYLRSGYQQLSVRGEDIKKPAFPTGYGHFDFFLISIGLTNNLTTFMDLMNKVFQSYLDSFVIVFIRKSWYIQKMRVNIWTI